MGIWVCPHCGKPLPRSMWDDRLRTMKVHPQELQDLIQEAQQAQRGEAVTTIDVASGVAPPAAAPPTGMLPPAPLAPPVAPPSDLEPPPSWDPTAKTDPGSFSKQMKILREQRTVNTISVAAIAAAVAIVCWLLLDRLLRR